MITLVPMFTSCELTVSPFVECDAVVLTHHEPRATMSPDKARALAAALVASAEVIDGHVAGLDVVPRM